MKMRIYPVIITLLIISFSKVSDAAVATLGACDMREAKIVYQLSGPEIGAAQPKITFKKAPASVEHMAKRGLPSARMIGFIACPNI